jgi:sphingomyelin phosphodiesterase
MTRAVLILFLFAPAILIYAQPQEKKEISLLSWNIYMLPRPFIKTDQSERAHAIAQVINEEDYGMIIFQEAFDFRARQIIRKALKKKYPYHSGRPYKNDFIKVSSGIWIFSQYPIKKKKNIGFAHCRTTDCFSSKGATLVEVEIEGSRIQVIGTHLQAWDGEKYQKTRFSQYREIKKLLLDKFKKDDVPQFLIGDLNTPIDDSLSYYNMLSTLDMEDGELNGEIQNSVNPFVNTLIKQKEGERHKLLDYILCRTNGSGVKVKERKIIRYTASSSGKTKDLSDHFAIKALIEF